MKNLLELYCSFAGWQGGTIHQALQDFAIRPLPEKDKFCNSVFRYGTEHLSNTDMSTFSIFLQNRMSYFLQNRMS